MTWKKCQRGGKRLVEKAGTRHISAVSSEMDGQLPLLDSKDPSGHPFICPTHSLIISRLCTGNSKKA